MKRTIEIGSAGGAAVTLDLDRLIETRLLIQGASGSGKSGAVRRLLEQTHGKLQHFVIDPEGEYSTLRERFDYVLAGVGGDCPLDARSASLLARRLLELGASAILDLSDVRPHERSRIVRLFLDGLNSAPRSLWHDALVVLEECHLWAPQAGREAESTNAVQDLATRGRKRGFALVAVTQRIADLNKSVVAQCGNKLIGRTTLDADVKRSAYDLGFERQDARRLMELNRREFFSHGPAFSTDRVTLVRVGDVSTKLAAGRGAKIVAPPAPEAVRAILGKLSDLPKEAAEEAKTIEELRAENARLKREAKSPAADPAQTKRLEELFTAADARANREMERAEAWYGLVVSARHATRALLDRFDKEHDEIGKRFGFASVIDDYQKPKVHVRLDIAPRIVKPGTPIVRVAQMAVDSVSQSMNGEDRKLGAERKLLVALVQRAPIRLTRAQLGTLCSLAHTGGTFSTYMSRLRSSGLIDEQNGLVTATADGIAACGAVAPAPTGDEILPMWIENVGRNAAGKLLAHLASVYPEAITRDELAQACGLTANAGTFSTYLSRLRSNSLIEERNGSVSVAPAVMGHVE